MAKWEHLGLQHALGEDALWQHYLGNVRELLIDRGLELLLETTEPSAPPAPGSTDPPALEPSSPASTDLPSATQPPPDLYALTPTCPSASIGSGAGGGD
ncbi:hypothetical protein JCM8547_001724 [Rhodosporidiobolus lusitaniae]